MKLEMLELEEYKLMIEKEIDIETDVVPTMTIRTVLKNDIELLEKIYNIIKIIEDKVDRRIHGNFTNESKDKEISFAGLFEFVGFYNETINENISLITINFSFKGNKSIVQKHPYISHEKEREIIKFF